MLLDIPESLKQFVHAQCPRLTMLLLCLSLSLLFTNALAPYYMALRRRNKWQQVYLLPDKFHFVSRTERTNEEQREFEPVPLVELDYNGNCFFLSLLSCFATLITIHTTWLYAKKCGRFEIHFLHLGNYEVFNMLWVHFSFTKKSRFN